jgi:hypothetical protein
MSDYISTGTEEEEQMHEHQSKEKHQGTETEQSRARGLNVSEKCPQRPCKHFERHTRQRLRQPLLLHPYQCTTRNSQCEPQHSWPCNPRGNRPASTPPNQAKNNRTGRNATKWLRNGSIKGSPEMHELRCMQDQCMLQTH